MIKKTLFSLFGFCVFYSSFSQKKQVPIRGTWVTNVASDALLSKNHIKNTVWLCKQKGINNIYVVVWNDGVTMYPSRVLESYIGIPQDPVYKGFDPLQTIIEEAHKNGIKVHAWFEFGFSYAYQDSLNKWRTEYPHWAGRNRKGELLIKNGFYWWNALHPEVQEFMKKLILEVVEKYDVDGIQGDDRLPAMPSEGGYDSITLLLYKQNTGKNAPDDCKDPEWVQWRADQLSAFGKMIYREVKKIKPSCIVSWSPSIYPWSKDEYLQDWPRWLYEGYADYVIPQLYRYNIKDYEKILRELNQQVTGQQKNKVFPGVLTSLGNGYVIKPEMLQHKIYLNRKYGFKGECLFYFEGLKKIKKIY